MGGDLELLKFTELSFLTTRSMFSFQSEGNLKEKGKTIKAMKTMRLARALHERWTEARHQRGPPHTGGRSLLNEANDMEN